MVLGREETGGLTGRHLLTAWNSLEERCCQTGGGDSGVRSTSASVRTDVRVWNGCTPSGMV